MSLSGLSEDKRTPIPIARKTVGSIKRTTVRTEKKHALDSMYMSKGLESHNFNIPYNHPEIFKYVKETR